MSNIIEFKSKKQKFKQWLEEVIKENFENENIESALIIWENRDEKIAYHSRFMCDFNTLRWFKECLSDKVKELEFDKFIREHIDEYIEIINQ